MKDILSKHVLYCKQLQRACKLHEMNPTVLKMDVLEVSKQDGRSVLYKTCKYDTDLVSASNVCSVKDSIYHQDLTVVSPLDIFLGKITGFYIRFRNHEDNFCTN